MTSPYEPLPTDSDHEMDHVSNTAIVSDDDDVRSDRTRSTDRTYYFPQGETDSDEDPEEDDPSETDPRSPMPTFNFGMRPRIRRTARKRVAMPNTQRWTRSRSPTPTAEPYVQPPSSFPMWEQTLQTLQKWKCGRSYSPIPTGEGPSAIRQEFLMDTTPIMVERISKHELRLDMMENIILDMPAYEGLIEQANEAEDNIAAVNDAVVDLSKKMEALTGKFKSMEHTIEQMDDKMHQCHTMQIMAQGVIEGYARESMKKGGK